MPYKFGKTSRTKLEGVHPDLIICASTAILISPLDFSITSGVRTVKEQRVLVNKGASQTMNSRHITGHAIDLVPYINGKVSWDWPLFDHLAFAMAKSAKWHKIPLRWGGTWSRIDQVTSIEDIRLMRKMYRGSFPDGPHFEIPR